MMENITQKNLTISTIYKENLGYGRKIGAISSPHAAHAKM
jgi:hypothetical protein